MRQRPISGLWRVGLHHWPDHPISSFTPLKHLICSQISVGCSGKQCDSSCRDKSESSTHYPAVGDRDRETSRFDTPHFPFSPTPALCNPFLQGFRRSMMIEMRGGNVPAKPGFSGPLVVPPTRLTCTAQDTADKRCALSMNQEARESSGSRLAMTVEEISLGPLNATIPTRAITKTEPLTEMHP